MSDVNSGPIPVALEKDKNYSWCTCGHTENEPFCDSSHRKNNATPSLKFSVSEEKTAYLCSCKKTSNPPYCDGSHKG
ncbi:MAG: CDGSH iron-sulfur domain-containing protein [Flavobacteriaceae bacterium]|jgi:CDGSH-type Zn-finger protein